MGFVAPLVTAAASLAAPAASAFAIHEAASGDKTKSPGATPGRDSQEAQQAALDRRRRSAAARGRQSTILGGASFAPTGQVAQKTLLGQ